MSLAMFIYSPAKDPADKTAGASASGKTSLYSHQSDFGAQARGHALRPRSIAFPTTVAVAILVLVLSLLKSTLVSASSDDERTLRQDLSQCQVSTSTPGSITCPLDLFPGLPITSARILIQSVPDSTEALSTCTLFARSASGGQARGVTIRADKAKQNWSLFPKLSTRHDDFRYVVCDLAQGATIGGLEVTINARPGEEATRLKAMIEKNLAKPAQRAPASTVSALR